MINRFLQSNSFILHLEKQDIKKQQLGPICSATQRQRWDENLVPGPIFFFLYYPFSLAFFLAHHMNIKGSLNGNFFFKRLSNEELCISSFAHQFGKHSLGTFYARNYPPRQWGMNK